MASIDRLRTFVGALTIAVCASGLTAVSQATTRPNIIVIMSDDMGYTDIQPYGSEIQTPNLQRMADEGLRFSQFYGTPRCSPTRAALMTGQYSHAVGMGHLAVNDFQSPGYTGDLRTDNNLTMAEVLRGAGYSTHAVGKWHLTNKIPATTSTDNKYNWPLQRGFDRYYGIIHGASRFFDPATLVRDNTPISPFSPAEQAIYPKTHYSVTEYVAAQQAVANNPSATPSAHKYNFTDAINDHAAMFINEHFSDPATHDKPLFQYVMHTAAHWPLHAVPEDVSKYDNAYGGGYQAIRQARFDAAKAEGLLPGVATLPAPASNWDALSPAMKLVEQQAMQVYAAQIDRMDQGIGRIMTALEANGQLENTIIMYLQDNGGNHEGGTAPNTLPADIPQRPNGPTSPPLADTDLQTATQTGAPTRDGYPVRRGWGVEAGAPDTYQFYSRQWGNVSNTPFADYKSDTGEGGIATPLVVRWGNGIDASLRGGIVHSPSHLIDILATFVDITGADYPTPGSSGINPLAGVSLAPAFAGEAITRDVPIFWEHEGWRAVRNGKWKAMTRGPAGPWQLFNMDVDRAETNDVAVQNPHIIVEMANQWETWALANDVISNSGQWPWNPKHPIGGVSVTPLPLILHARFDETSLTNGSSVADSSGNDFHGVLTANDSQNHSTTAGVPAGLSRAIDVNGDVVDFDLSYSLPAGARQRTVTAWVNADTLGDRRFIGYGSGDGGTFLLTLEGTNNDAHVKFRHGGGNIQFEPAAGSEISVGEWVHVALVVPEGATMTDDVLVYINGVAVDGVRSGGTNQPLLTNSSLFGVGVRGGNSPGGMETNLGFDGRIADVQLYGVALGAQQISMLYNNPSTAIGFAGDFNLDGHLNQDDFLSLLEHLHADVSHLSGLSLYVTGDLTGDGRITYEDLASFRSVYNLQHGSGAFEVMVRGVPEPSMAAMAACGFAMSCLYRRPARASEANTAVDDAPSHTRAGSTMPK